MGTLETAPGADAAMGLLTDALQGHPRGPRCYLCLPHPLWETSPGAPPRALGWCGCVATIGTRLDALCVVGADGTSTITQTRLATRIDGAVAFAERHLAELNGGFILARAVDAHTRRTVLWLHGGRHDGDRFIPLEDTGRFRMLDAGSLEAWLADRGPIEALP